MPWSRLDGQMARWTAGWADGWAALLGRQFATGMNGDTGLTPPPGERGGVAVRPDTGRGPRVAPIHRDLRNHRARTHRTVGRPEAAGASTSVRVACRGPSWPIPRATGPGSRNLLRCTPSTGALGPVVERRRIRRRPHGTGP